MSILAFITSATGQINGDWYGVGSINKAGAYDSYMVEMILTQTGNKVTGQLNYFFKSEKIESTITGTYLPNSRTLELRATPVLNYQAKDANGADCPMEGSFTFMSSQLETTLRGQFNPTYNYRLTCPAINIKFKKQLIKPDEVVLKAPVQVEQLLVFDEPDKPKPIDPAVILLSKRAIDVVDEIEIESDSITAIFYDNSEIDNDTISVFYNKNLIASKKMLSDKPMTFRLAINDTGISEINMYAENLGKLPPNTALLIVMDGEKRMEFNLLSNYIKSSTLRFRKKQSASVQKTN